MEEKSLRIDADKTFFTKMLIPTKIGINGMLISMKRNNVLKAYEMNAQIENSEEEIEKKETSLKKYEDTFALYLEAIDKHVMDSIYKKVKNDTATEFEKDALAR